MQRSPRGRTPARQALDLDCWGLGGKNECLEDCRDSVAVGVTGQVQDVVIRTLVADPVSGYEHAFGASFLRGNASSDRCPIGPSTAVWPTRSLQAHRAAAYTTPRPTNKVASLDYK